MISAAANVGIATRVINEIDNIDHANNDIFIIGKSGCLHFSIVTIKLIEPSTDDRPKIFNPNIHNSAEGPGARIIEYGGYAVHPRSANPSQTIAAPTGIIQNATAFNFGHAISLYLTKIGIK